MGQTERRLTLARIDSFYFAKTFVMTFDENDGNWKKYPDWQYLDRVHQMINQPPPNNRYWRKSQRMLITISFCAAYLWDFLYSDGSNQLWIGKNERSVDNGGANSDWNSAFGKIRMMYDKLPGEVKEDALGRVYHSKELFKFKSVQNPRNNNVIMGQSPTSDAGVGEGFTRAVCDEAASIPYLNIIHTNLSQSCKWNRHYISFPLGKNNFFYKIHSTPGHFTFDEMKIHWRLNPNYTDEWYEQQKKLMTPFEIAQRLDMSFEESSVGLVFDKFNYSKIVKPTEYLPEFPVFHIWDYGFKDATSFGFCQYDRVNDKFRIFDWVENEFTPYYENAKDFNAVKEKYGFVDSQGYGDPAGKAVEQSSGVSLNDQYAEFGIYIEPCDQHETIATIDNINMWLESERIQIDPKCVPIIESMQNWEWPKDAKGNPKPGATQPRHDKYSHAGKALEYGFHMICVETTPDIRSYLEASSDVAKHRMFNPAEF